MNTSRYNKYYPLVTVIVNCYNGSRHLREAIDSIICQSYENWELVFWDNCSTDNSPLIVKDYMKEYKNIKYFKSPKHVGLGHARKLAVERAEGEWLAFLDTDDIWYKNKLERQISEVEGSDYILCYSGIDIITENNKLVTKVYPRIKSGYILNDLLRQFEINMVSPLIKRSVMEENNITFNPLIVASEEYNLFVRLSARGNILVLRDDILGAWRAQNVSLTSKSMISWSTDRFLTLKQLVKENRLMVDSFIGELRIAYNKGFYYKARYLIEIGNITHARRILKILAHRQNIYKTIYLLSYSILAWKVFHNPYLKQIYRSIILKILK